MLLSGDLSYHHHSCAKGVLAVADPSLVWELDRVAREGPWAPPRSVVPTGFLMADAPPALMPMLWYCKVERALAARTGLPVAGWPPAIRPGWVAVEAPVIPGVY